MRAAVKGFIVADDDAEVYRWFGYTVTAPADVRKAIEDNPEGEPLILEVNSPGGNMFAGYEMYSALKAATCATQAEIQSISASASSTAMLGTDEVKASPVAQVMIHLPSMQTQGDALAHRKSAEALDKFRVSILNAYELKCRGKKTRQELEAMLEAETWLPVQEALAVGLVDGVLYDEEGIIASQVVNCVGSGIRTLSAMGGLPAAAELRAKMETQNPVPQPGGGPDENTVLEKLKASLALKQYI